MSRLTKRTSVDRSKIDTSDADQIKRWTKTLNVSQDDLLRAIEKVGNAAATVRKELLTKTEGRLLKPTDFPVSAAGTAVVTQDGQPIAETSNSVMAEDVAERLNYNETLREEDKWSA
jgi:hypothetical protein